MMCKRLGTVMIAWLALSAGLGEGFALEPPGRSPVLPAAVMGGVHRTLPSKSGDVFVVLSNGLTVLVRQQPNCGVMSAQVFVRAGSILEGRYLTAGVSHYLEHVVSGGTTRSFTEDEAKEKLQRMGGMTNAYTSSDRTVYYINTSSHQWKDALSLLLSYVSESTLDPREVAREKQVIQQEIKMGENNPDSELWKMFLRTAYQVSPVRHPIIGYEDVFVHLDRDALEDYYRDRYQPENMVVVVVGDVDPGEVLRFVVEKSRSFDRRANPPVAIPEEPDQASPRWQERESPIARMTQAMVGFPSVTMYSKDMYASDVLARLLGEGQTSRLHRRLKDQESLVLSVGASNWTPSYVAGQLIISLTLPPRNWPGVLKSVEEEINRFKTELITAEDLEKAKKAAIAHHIFGKETAASQAASLASSYFETGDPYFDETYVEETRRVTSEQVREVARKILDMERVNVAVVHPAKPPLPEAPAAAEPAQGAVPSAKASPVATFQLDNGLKVLLKKDATLPLVTLQLYGLGGLYFEGSHKAGISALTASLLTAGTKNRDKMAIARAIEDVGGGIESKSDNNTYHISIKVLKEDLDTALDILADVVQNAQFPQEEIEKKRQDTLLAIQRLDENWQGEILRLFRKNYFKDSPYERDRIGTADSVRSITREDLVTFYQRMVNPHHSALTIYGDIDPSKLQSALRVKLGAWERRPVPLPELVEETRMIEADRVVEKKNEKVSAGLLIGANGLDVLDPHRPVLEVMDAILSGTGVPGGRLFNALRGGSEDLVYLVGAFPFYAKKAGFFGVITQTTFGNLDKVQNIILGHLKRLAEEPVPQAELETAKDMLITSMHLQMESLDAQAQNAALNEVLGLGWEYEQKMPELIRRVKAEEVQNLARDLFAHLLIARTLPENPVEILAAPMPKGEIRAPFQ